LLGGSRFQIGGPAGAFIVLVAGTVAAHGVQGLLLATFLSGLILLAAGVLRLGTFIRYIPYPVTVGFTAGIATLILASQIKDLFGLHLAGPEPSAFLPKLLALGAALPTADPPSLALAGLSIGLIVLVRRFLPGWPNLLIAIVVVSGVAALLQVPVDTIGTRFGGIPRSMPAPHLPVFTLRGVVDLLPTACAFALLGSIESLLSAVVADSMSGRRHRSNSELIAQGVANIGASLFGGLCVTGTIARTATNVRSGAHGPVAGMLHALFLLGFMLLAAPLASYIPLSALAGLLVTVAWNMAEKHAFASLLRASRGDALVLLATFTLTLLRDLTEGIVVGFALASLVFVHRMSQAIDVSAGLPAVFDEEGDGEHGETPGRGDVAVHRISGAFFFGAAATVGAALDRVAMAPRAHVMDFSAVTVIDSTAAVTLEGFVRRARNQRAQVYITGTVPAVRRELLAQGMREPQVRYRNTVEDALAEARATQS
jgi:SulP family sulfate permease